MPDLRIIFMGTAELACASLEALCRAQGVQLVAVVTQPDRPKGREMKLRPSAVKEVALAHGLPVLQPARARNEDFIQQLKGYSPELIVVTAYGQILPRSILDMPRFGCINVHTSLLPKYRGAAPIQWAILNDESVTGVTIMKMDAGLDTGEILSQAQTTIEHADNSQTLHDRLASMGAELLVQTISGYISGTIALRQQPAEGASYARKITKEDGHLDWTQPARVLWNRVRAFTPWPGAFTWSGTKPDLLKIWSAEVEETNSGIAGQVLQADKQGLVIACGQHALRLLEVQREGGRRVKAHEYLSGHPMSVGDQLK